MVRRRIVSSPVGALELTADDRALVSLRFARGAKRASDEPHPILDCAERELDEYFRGARRRFSVPLAPEGTPFQKQVWKALLAIPCGETKSYGDIARAIGRPQASRAVGAANGQNPLAVIVPCHRVIGADKTLTGYGGGLARKRWLLDHEGVAVD